MNIKSIPKVRIMNKSKLARFKSKEAGKTNLALILATCVSLVAVPVQADTSLTGGFNCGVGGLTTTGTATGQVIIGCAADGSFEVNANTTGNAITTVNANGAGSISLVSGYSTGAASGRILVNGNGTAGSATLNSLHSIEVGLSTTALGGSRGTGNLTIQNGGLVQITTNDNGITIGNDNSTGVVTVDGVNSVLTVRNRINIGQFNNSSGTLAISNGGLVQATGTTDNGIFIGERFGNGLGTVTVTGNGSTLSASTVAVFGGGLTVQDGGTVTIETLSSNDGFLTVGGDADSPSTVTVTGAGSKIQVVPKTSGLEKVLIGGFANGTLVIDNSAIVNASGVNVNVSGGIDGTSTSSPGVLTVKNGASLTADSVSINVNGTLNGNGTIHGNVTLNGGTIAPGNSPGTLTIDGDYTQVDGDLIIEIAGTGAGEFDILDILGTATFDPGATIDISFTNGFAPSAGDVFDFLKTNIFASDMSLVNFTILGLEPGFQFDIGSTGAGTLNITALNNGVSAVPLPGAVWLFGSGLIGLIGIAKRKKS